MLCEAFSDTMSTVIAKILTSRGFSTWDYSHVPLKGSSECSQLTSIAERLYTAGLSVALRVECVSLKKRKRGAKK